MKRGLFNHFQWFTTSFALSSLSSLVLYLPVRLFSMPHFPQSIQFQFFFLFLVVFMTFLIGNLFFMFLLYCCFGLLFILLPLPFSCTSHRSPPLHPTIPSHSNKSNTEKYLANKMTATTATIDCIVSVKSSRNGFTYDFLQLP